MLAARRRPALVALLLAGALALSACSGGGGDDDGAGDGASSAASSAAPAAVGKADLSKITVTPPAEGATGAAAVPAVTVPAGFSTGETTTTVLSEGTGDPISAGEVVSVEFVGLNGASGKQFGASSWSGKPVQFVLGPGVIPGFSKALDGAKVGDRVLTAVAPVDGYGPQGGLPQASIGASDTLVYLIDVLGVSPGWATGTPETAPLPAGVTSVTVDQQTHAPTIVVDSKASPPTQLVKQVLVTGKGAPVQNGQQLTMQYTGVTWSTGKEFDSSWKRGAPFDFQLGAGQVIKGWDQGLEGVPVGSQVLLVIPPALGYEDKAQGDIPANSTLVFVVDVLAAQ
ncbi:FKBP-type peptidyl-prolyl cis-trans isomerase [Quadrisphaera granulorum]|uniref:peptidylprolyl isomerase n=1 Tax=Quadrisphaera granulorum TaxID=317664 RepID=A0A316A5J6_9ACTN|nr:FKBP-type peptidyl-prolyl cis-trans isomerase [Quadrisphaera granulorum]PWJ53176.1 FKBP-type peptidyl-prolyl isomerase-like protein [Quadrisphaera granulorum]SZE97108.1 FKBP-type peptidyl-prolyl cis-trans isomerase [Quadrisphaera granulorum]